MSVLLERIKQGDENISSHLPIAYESHWPKFYKAMGGSWDSVYELHKVVPNLDVVTIGQDGPVWRVGLKNQDGGETIWGSSENPTSAWLIALVKVIEEI